MTNKLASADHSLTTGPVPFRFGFSRTDDLIAEASKAGKEFAVEFGKPLFRASIGGRPIGFAYPYTCDVVRWPSIEQDFSIVEVLHAAAENDTRGKCYFIGGEVGAIKIGFSIDVPSRLKAIQSCSPIPVAVLATRSGGETRERAYHAQFEDHRLHGEWFTRCPEIEAEIARLSTPTPEPHHDQP